MSTWDDLSMSDKAKYIQLGVQNGITNLSSIRESYNKYQDGGYIGDRDHPIALGDTVEITPQKSALNVSRQSTTPNSDFSTAKDMHSLGRFVNNHFTWLPGIDPHTCINTVTGFYNPKETVASNAKFVANPQKYGYTEIDQQDAIPGDIIILSDKDNFPHHAVMFDQVADKGGVHNNYQYAEGDTLVNYSNGGRSPQDYRLQGPLSRFSDPHHSGGDFSGVHRYFRYIGKKSQ